MFFRFGIFFHKSLTNRDRYRVVHQIKAKIISLSIFSSNISLYRHVINIHISGNTSQISDLGLSYTY